MQVIKMNQTLAFENKTYRRGETLKVQNSTAKQLSDNGLVEIVDEDAGEDVAPEQSANSITFSNSDGKKQYDSGTTKKHVEDDKKKATVTVEPKKEQTETKKKEK